MNKVLQENSTDCMRACLATYFGCPLADIPLFNTDDWIKDVRKWTKPKGFGFVTISVPDESVFLETFSSGDLIVSGKSRRGIDHAVIYKNGQLWHDPHPDSSGIVSVEYVHYFYPLDMVAK